MHRKFGKLVIAGIITLMMILTLGHSVSQPVQSARELTETAIGLNDPLSNVIEKYRELIPDLMKQQKIPGVAIALVDGGQVLWSEGFGYTDWDRSTMVTADTPFSIQSISKTFTATVVMLAIQEGLVDLDTPLSTYLPDFKVNSIFEENPAAKITIRHLLSHTAGFTMEAPLGNNNQSNVATFEDHVSSIQQTWLKFPVGEGYGYSNLGIDLAAYIVQVQSGMPFPQFAKEKLLDPLGMVNSSYDLDVIEQNSNRAIGHGSILNHIPLSPLLASGGLYTSANDAARFLQFLSNNGNVNGVQILNTDLIDTMSTHHFVASAEEEYGLGVGVSTDYNTLELIHGGGGFGFLSLMTYYPELELGLIWMTNSGGHNLQNEFSDGIINDVIVAGLDTYKQRVMENSVPPTRSFGPKDIQPLTNTEREDTIRNLSLQTTSDSLARWKSYTGLYFGTSFGRKFDPFWIRLKNGALEINQLKLYEIQPGLFFTSDGEALDMRGAIPAFRSIELSKMSQAWVISMVGFMGLCALAFIGALGWVSVSAIRRTIKRSNTNSFPLVLAPADHIRLWLMGLGCIWGLSLITVCYLFPALLVDWFPSPLNPNLLLWQKVIFAAPIGMFVFGATASILWILRQKSHDKGWLPLRGDLLIPILMVAFALVLFF